MSGFGEQVDEAVGFLERMPRIVVDALPDATRRGAKVGRARARANAPRRSGRLVDSIDEELVASTTQSATSRVFVGVFYGRIVEEGRGPVRPTERQALRVAGDVVRASAGAVRKRPFFRPAIEAAAGEIGEAIEDEVAQAIERARR